MMTKRKVWTGLGVLFVFACLFVFAAGLFFPRALAFLDGFACPDGMRLDNQAETRVNDVGNEVDAVSMVCSGEGRTPVDATPRMLMLLFALALIAGAFLTAGSGGIQRVG
jgi:hypothetical protein